MKSFRIKAFTLSELLVCILIIVILVSILLPSINSAKKAASTTVCISNLRQIHSALMLYETDHGSYPPNSVVWPGFRSYYPTVLSCPFSTLPAEFHYVLLGSFSDRTAETGEKLSDLQEECRANRGGSIPLAIDLNHIGQQIAPQNQFPVIVLRENGAVDRVPANQAFYGTKPCDPSLTYLNF
jgi:prepilin-type N-terminal cleavage/methylation domain-containing protein